jgi:hypothetical protein
MAAAMAGACRRGRLPAGGACASQRRPEFEYTGIPICAGDVLTSVGKTVSIDQVPSSLGQMLITRRESTPIQNGEVVAQLRRASTTRRRRDMAEQVYWDDVKEGDDRSCMVKNCSTQQLVQRGRLRRLLPDPLRRDFAKSTGLRTSSTAR